MRKLEFGIVAALVMSTAAQAADMAVKAPPMAPPVYSWTGCYIGGNVGGAWHHADQTASRNIRGTIFATPYDLGSANSNGDFIGGAQIGCDYQFAGKWVVGIQGMFDFGNTNSTGNLTDARLTAAFTNPYVTTRTRDLYTVTGRIGYLFTPQLLGYVKGGGAWTNTYTAIYSSAPAAYLSESGSADRIGYTVGGGLEHMFAKGWSVFGEYNYADFGRKDIANIAGPLTTSGSATINATRLTMQTALFGVNYKFNFASPVVAKY
jgi:outer membrane immunogenic protein